MQPSSHKAQKSVNDFSASVNVDSPSDLLAAFSQRKGPATEVACSNTVSRGVTRRKWPLVPARGECKPKFCPNPDLRRPFAGADCRQRWGAKANWRACMHWHFAGSTCQTLALTCLKYPPGWTLLALWGIHGDNSASTLPWTRSTGSSTGTMREIKLVKPTRQPARQPLGSRHYLDGRLALLASWIACALTSLPLA